MNLPGPSDAPAAPELHRDVDVDERAARRAVERRDREAGGSATGPDVPQHAGRNTRRSGRVLVQAQRHPETARVVRRPVGVAARIAIRALRHAPAGGGAVDLELGVAIGPRIVATRDPRCRRRDDEREHGEQRGGRQPVLLLLAASVALQRAPGSPLDRLPANIEMLTLFGERADISPDNARIAFMAKSFGDAMVVDLKTRAIRCLTCGVPGAAFLRVTTFFVSIVQRTPPPSCSVTTSATPHTPAGTSLLTHRPSAPRWNVFPYRFVVTRQVSGATSAVVKKTCWNSQRSVVSARFISHSAPSNASSALDPCPLK